MNFESPLVGGVQIKMPDSVCDSKLLKNLLGDQVQEQCRYEKYV